MAVFNPAKLKSNPGDEDIGRGNGIAVGSPCRARVRLLERGNGNTVTYSGLRTVL